MSRALQLWERFKSEDDLKELIGAEFFEDQHIDFKSQFWGPDSWEQCFAEILSGFANADGGLVIFGAKANSEKITDINTKRELIKDVVSKLTPLKEYQHYAQQLNNRANSLTQPEMHGIIIDKFPSKDDPSKGYIKVYIPKSEGPVLYRSAKNYRFFCRIGHSIKDMPIYMMTDRMGRRPHPKFRIELTVKNVRRNFSKIPSDPLYEISLDISIWNIGKGAGKDVFLTYVCSSKLPRRQYDFALLDGNLLSYERIPLELHNGTIYPGMFNRNVTSTLISVPKSDFIHGTYQLIFNLYCDEFHQTLMCEINESQILKLHEEASSQFGNKRTYIIKSS